MEISKQIKNYRTKNQLTQKELGDLLNVSDKTISSWENDRTYPDISLIIKLAEMFDLSLDDFLKGDASTVKKIDRDLYVKNIYKYLLIGGIFVILSLLLFLNTYQYKNQWVDRFNPFLKMELGYATVPTTVTYNGGHDYQENSETSQIPDPYENIIVLDSPFGEATMLTFVGGQAPKDKNYVIVQHKGLYVKNTTFISWNAIPPIYQENMSKKYVSTDGLDVPTKHFYRTLTD